MNVHPTIRHRSESRANLVAVLAVTFAAGTAATAETIHVPDNAPTIQIAITIAQPFDTIIVAPGTYYEAISYGGKVIAIQSEDPNDPDTVADTIIDAAALGTVVTFAGSEGSAHATLNGFTITGGGTGIDGYDTDATIQNCVIRDNTGYGIANVAGEITNCEIKDNSSSGIRACDGTIFRCRIVNNSSGLLECDNGTIRECQILNNRSNGIHSCNNGLIEGCVISNNVGYGILTSSATIRQSIISGNGNNGLYACNGWRIENSIVAGNKQNGLQNCSADVLNCTVTGNRQYGFWSHTGPIEQCVIWDNDVGPLLASTTPILSGTVNPFFIQPGHWDNINNIWIEGDYHVASDSPYIDAGSPLYPDDVDDPTEDLDGNPRVVGARVDIGAYEFQAPCEGDDFDGDGMADICDRDIDDDGASNTLDPCDFTPAGIPVGPDGRPLGDLNLDCKVDLRDYAVFQLSVSGP